MTVPEPITYLLLLDRLDEHGARWLTFPDGKPDFTGPVFQLPRATFEAMGRPTSILITPKEAGGVDA